MDSLISVIVPVYKVEPYVECCLRSIMNQSYRNLEILVVDDGSPDNSGEICRRLALEDSRIQVFRKENGGLSDARNYGTARASGEYICFVDSDDFIAENYIAYLADLIDRYHADISCCALQRFTDEKDYCNRAEEKITVFNGRTACRALLWFNGEYTEPLLVAYCKLYKAEIVKAYPFPFGRKHEDNGTTYKYLYNSDTVVAGKAELYAYRLRPGSIISSLGEEKNTDYIELGIERAEYFEEKGEKELAQLAWQNTFMVLYDDSPLHGGRCDEDIRNCLKGRWYTGNIAPATLIRCGVYLASPKLFAWCRKTYPELRKVFNSKKK